MKYFLISSLLIPCAVSFADASGVFTLRDLGDGNAEISAYTGRETQLCVPAEIDGKRVIRISENAFFGKGNLRSVEFSSTLSEIAPYAFAHCSNLEKIEFPENLEKIGKRAFFACGKLSALNLPETVVSVGDEAFAFCSELQAITAPAQISEFGKNVFPLTSAALFPKSHFASLEIDGEGVVFSDANGNAAIDGAEVCTIRVPVKNAGNTTAYGCRVRTILQNPGAHLSFSSAVGLPQIRAGETLVAEIPISADREITTGTQTFEFFAEEPNGFNSEKKILALETRPFVAPELKIVDFLVSGKGDASLKKNSPFDLQVFLQNTTAGTAENVSLELELPNGIVLLDGEKSFSFEKLSGGEAKPLEFSLLVPRRYTKNEIPVRVKISEKYGQYAESREIVLRLNDTIATTKTVVAQNSADKEIELASFTSDVDKNIPVNPELPERNIFVAVVANENYRFVAPVAFAQNDGRIFYEYCRKTLGVPESQIKFFKNATVGEMNEALAWLEARGKLKDAELVFFYSGHGIPDDETRTAYLLPTDASPANLGYITPLNAVYEQLSRSRAQKALVFLDACFSGMRRDNAPMVAAKGVRRAVPAGDISTLAPNLVVFTAASGDQTAHFAKSEKHGLFTYALLKKLKETRGNVSLEELGTYLRDSVPEQSLKFGDFEQTPSILAHDEFPHWEDKLYPEKK